MQGLPKLPQMTDMYELFNPNIAPPSLVATKKVVGNNSGLPGSAGHTTRGVTKILKGMGRRNSKYDQISLPTNFRHVVHVGSDRIEVYDEKGNPVKVSDKKRQVQILDVALERKQGGFGLSIKTLENGKTVVSNVAEGGAAQTSGLQIHDEITHIDGDAIEGLRHEDVISKLKGKNVANLKIARASGPAGAGSGTGASGSTAAAQTGNVGASGEDQDAFPCRVCGAVATFNCSACGPHITYCSVECQKSDWPTHKQECMSLRKSGTNTTNTNSKEEKQGSGDSGTTPNTGACRVCRAKNARFRCVCGGAMYCSQQCQDADWANHKNSCTAVEGEAPKITGVESSKFTFFAVAERWLSKMVFVNGVFDCKWTVPLTSPDDKVPMYPTTHISDNAIFVGFADRLTSIDLESGSQNWIASMSYPFDGSPLAMVDWEDLIIVGGKGHVIAYERRYGEEVWRKLLHADFLPVTLLLRNSVLFATCGENAYCVILDEDEAKLAWRATVSTNEVAKSMALANGPKNTSYLVIAGEKTVSLKTFEGKVNKAVAMPNQESNQAVSISIKDDILIVLRNGVVTRYDPTDLAILWELTIPDCEGYGTLLQSEICFSTDGRVDTEQSDVVYIGINSRVVAMDAEAGDIKWIAKLTKPEGDMSTAVTMVLLGDDIIAATAGRVFAISANSGNPLRKAQLPQKDNQSRLVAIVAQEGSDRSTSFVANNGSLYPRN